MGYVYQHNYRLQGNQEDEIPPHLQRNLSIALKYGMIPISKPCVGEEETQAVAAVLESGQLAQGKRVIEFEKQFAAFCGVKHAIATSSGTTALWIALLANNIGAGDEVITSPFTFMASAHAIVYTGARPVFVDIDPETFNLDPSKIEARITPRTKAILPIHLYGHPCDMLTMKDLAHCHKLAVIEDACQAHGAAINGQKVGNFGTGCFSFYATKNMTTGEGGMITTNDDVVADRARLLRAHGMRERYYHETREVNTSGGRRRNYTSAEDTVVRRFYAGEIGRAESIRLTGRSLDSLWRRGRLLGLTWQKPKLTWEWLDTCCDPESGYSS